MKRRYTAFMLALLMLAQVFAPEVARAKTSEPTKKTTVQLVKMGALDPKTYPKLDKKAILAIQKQARTNQSRFRTGRSGFFSVGSPYLPGQNPTDNEKAAAYGNLRVEFVTEGLKDKGEPKPFQWNEIFGTDSNGNPGTANIYFVQRDAKTNKEINTFKLTVDKAGKYSLKDLYGKPAKLPLYSKALEPYKYEVELETGVSEKITLLTMNLSNTGSETSSYTTDSEGNLVADIPLYLKIGQTASTKFVSKWNTNVQEAKRPKVVGGFNNKTADDYNYFPFPINDTDVLKIRREQFDLDKDEWPGYMPQTPIQLREVPKVTVDEDKLEDPETYTIDKNAKRITANDKVYKYDLEYDVINGGKLTMTEILPVTFDANGGKFASITDPNAEQKIKKEVDYDGTLTDKAEKPTKDRETFKGWSTTEDGKTPATDADFKNITKAKTFYAIWDNNAIAAEELTVHESFKADGATEYTNDFIPTLETLKGQVTIKDGNGDPQALANDDIFAIVDGSNEYKADGDDLKNYLYDKLKEEDTTEVSRKVTVKAKVTHANGTSQTVDIPIKVVKNIYEAKTLTDRPYYVPTDYVKVIVDPTTKAKDPQKTYYYVNPEAKVVIPGEDPTGTDGNQFTKWLIKGTKTEYKLSEHPRYQFSGETTIEAQYVSDVISPNEDGSKPDTVPKNYVEVKFVPTDKATDATKAEKIFWVNPEKKVTIPVANPVGKTYYTFKEWKVGVNAEGAVYKPNEAQKFEQATTITATYDESKNIIPYDPSAADPMVRPEGYVRVTFAADPGLKLKEQKAYYVKKNANIKLGDPTLVKPKYEPETGYKFKEWDKDDTTPIGANDIVVTAKATPFDEFIPQKNTDGTDKPKGYVTVTFVADKNGEIRDNGTKVDKKVYYVNPNKFVKLPAPTPVGNTGYDFSTWKSDKSQSDFSLANFVNYKENTVITAMFNQKDAVYPKLDGSTKPAGYVEVTFAISGIGGKIADSEVKTYYVDPTRQVSLKAPKTMAGTGFIFDKWRLGTNPTDPIINPADQKQYTVNTTIYGSFTKLKDIIPATNQDGTPNLQPIDYVAVLFIGGDHANSVDGQILYYVNPKANPAKTIRDLTKPTVKPDTGWKHTGWDVQDSTVINDYTFVVAQYEAIDDVIPALKDDGTPNEKPAGYVTVTFKSGDNGKIQENSKDITEKVYYVNPAKYVKLTPPTPVPNTSYEFSTWCSNGEDFILANNINYTKDTTITAKFNPEGDVIPETKPDGTANNKPANFVTVNFVIDPATGGKIEAGQTTTYFVRPNTDVTIQPPKTKANVGYEFEKWSIDTTEVRSYSDPVTTVKGEFTKLDEIIPSKNPDGTVNAKPQGYVTVQFLKGKNGVLDGQTTFYVNPNAGKKLKDLDTSGITVVPSPTYKFEAWDKPMSTPIKGPDNINVTATYTQLPNIIKAGPKDTAPDGYVVIIFETDGRGTITGNAAYEDKTNPKTNENEIVYFVNPDKGVKLAAANATASDTVLPVPSTAPYDATKYGFDQWRADIDTETPITRGRVHIAMFKPKQVKLTYDAGGATEGTAPAEVKVDYNTSVRLANQGDLKKTDASFAGWTIDGKDYKVGEEIILTKDSKAIAKWTNDKTIIPYDPIKNPTTRPDDTYVRVTFAADPGLKLTQQKAYYVKKNAGITLGNAELKKPGYEAETGYKFVKWDKEDALVIEASDIVVTAKAASIPDFVEKTNEHPNKPDDKYVTVTFKADNSGNGTVKEKTYFVNPNKYVTLTPPDDAKGNTGYEFGAWSQDAKIPTVYDKDTTITASFNGLGDVIPKTKKDESEKPPGYVTVTFEANKQGQIPADEITVYYVDPNRDVIINPPTAKGNTGYEFEKWDKKTTRKQRYDKDTTVTASFTKLDDIVDGSKPKPAGYVTVKFYKGDHGELSGQTVFYVNPEANPLKTIGDIKPTVTPETGWEFVGWPVPDKTKIDRNFDITAKYVGIPDVVPKDNPEGGENKIPDKYITVTFSTEENGKIKDTTNTKTKVVYVNPNKAVALDTFAPAVDPNTGFDFASWDTQIERAIQYKDKDVIKAKYNAKDDVIPQGKTGGSDKPAGYLTVTFDKGEHGTLSGKTVYYVKPNKEVTVPAPTVTPATGFKQKDGAEAWDKQLTQTFTKDTTIRAQYDSIKEVVPQKNTDGSDRPSGYKTVRFVGEHGTLAVDTVFYVNPEKVVDFTNTVNGFTKTPDFSYTDVGGTWSSEEFNKKFTDDTTFTFTFKKLGNVIPQKNPNGTTNDQPQGYVKVTLIPTAKATDDTKENKVFFVNPKETVEIKNKPQGKEITANGSKSSFKFIGWTVTRGSIASWPGEAISGKFIEETEITAKYEFTWINIVKEPIAEENIVTGKGDRPKPEDLIKNKYDKNNPTNTNNLPEGTTFTYEEEPKVDNVGNITAKVKVEYPGGATTIVEVPIKVVEHVVPQTGGESGSKPLVPASYVKVTVDTTDKAADNTKFVKVFWVKPNVEVKIPGILDPTGKLETDAKGVTLTNNFKKWKLEDSNPEITYDHGTDIKGIFTAKESKIVAIYGYGKNVDPQPNSGQWIPKGSVPSPKDFIKNPYNDDDPNNSNNLPPGTRFDFVPGSEPNTNQPGTNNSTSIKITYPNGETKTVDVTYNVTGDVVEQKDPNTKPVVPDEFVKVIVDKTQNAKLAAGESQTQVFWVNPTKTVTIPVDAPTANKEDMVFTEWDNQLTQQFTAKETTITAKFSKKQTPLPTAGYVITERGVQPKPDDYKKVITPPAGKTIKRVAVVTEPNVDKGGMTTARVSVTYEDNTTVQIPVQVFVQNKEQPYPTPQPDPIPQPYPTPQPNFVPYPVPGETKTVYKDRTVLRREVRYMQGFEGKFRPDDGLTRAEAAQILANALKEDGYPFDLRYKLPYKDTTKEMWYNDAVRITTQADVFIGYDDGEFKPQRKITRAEWIATLRRFQYVDKVGGNSLHMRKNHWAIPEVEAAYRSGWLSIYTEKKAPFNYDEPISRKEVAAVSNRAFRRVRDMDYIRRNDKFMINYTDINRDMWAYDDILCASNTFLHQRQGAYIAYKRGDKAYTIDVKDAIIEQDLFQRIPRHR
ncbi:InlB B-repeat-containing protein [Peptoniphilus sp. EMRHCC_23]|uniref:InlB B-repeat-containing protein n=1 Tax=Peptoniphilus rachelemmaiella TaxID=2811779 RepID=UPI001BFFECA1|nr:Rib/alpha-like domain-containing protein [Peptoniphilus rachelemmaiella]